MARSQREDEVAIKLDDISGSPCSNNFQGRSESLRRRNKEFWDQENHLGYLNSGRAEVVKCSSNASFRVRSWKSVMSMTKSRLIDPPEEPCQSSVNSGRIPEKVQDYEEDDDIDDIPEEYKRMKFSKLTMLQSVSLVLIVVSLACSLWFPVIKRCIVWDLPLWKWEIMVLALICGRLASGWGIRVVVFFIERNFLLRKRVLYFVYGLRKSVQNCLWLGLVLLVWHSIFHDKFKKKTESKILPYVNRVFVCLIVGTLIWLMKTLLVKVLASTFHVNTFFERIQEALFNQYVIKILSSSPLFERHDTEEEVLAELQELEKAGVTLPGELGTTLPPRCRKVIGIGRERKIPMIGKNSRFSRTMYKREDEEISVDHLHKLNQKNISAWNMKRMVNIVQHGDLSTLDEQLLNSKIQDEALLQIRSECQAKEAANRIFQNVAKPGSECICLEDVMRFMSKEEALKTMHLFGVAAESKGISESFHMDWMVKAFRERRALALSLTDTKTAVDELHNLLNIIVAIITLIIWLIILKVPITHFLVFLSSQLVLVVFMFGNTCRTVFEAIIFLFVIHPFDVGDRCEVDGVMMVVDEMNILTTVFLRYDNQKIIYPNSILATKPIGNYQRSPDMGDAIDFCINISTPMEKITSMKERITGYIEGKKEHWQPGPMVIMRDVIDMNKLMMSVWLGHRLNYQDIKERFLRREALLEEMIKIFKELDIEYRLLPVDVNVQNLPPPVSNRLPSTWKTYAS
ncbi:mechanosensitive ion channel protein 6-like [Quercus robur]|uniref:Mechanosensitive ion channel protein n=1 Tax=Quercus lobata TaxID=97700 RepID=A0A7N2QYG6_QUELO|nr:mechanosensitive ion channel protein 6-like [Quercus lobata]XP_050267785.1 mechanosensitive ion channel protein 6-like [Quercus robur]